MKEYKKDKRVENKKRIVEISILVWFEMRRNFLFKGENIASKGKRSMGFLMLIIDYMLGLIDYIGPIMEDF